MNGSLIYLAGPYSADPERYYKLHMKYAAALLKANRLVFSPILHCHPLAKEYDLPGDYEFWNHYNHYMLGLCDKLWVMAVPDWEESKGVSGEVAFANNHEIPVSLITLHNGEVIPIHKEVSCLTDSKN